MYHIQSEVVWSKELTPVGSVTKRLSERLQSDRNTILNESSTHSQLTASRAVTPLTLPDVGYTRSIFGLFPAPSPGLSPTTSRGTSPVQKRFRLVESAHSSKSSHVSHQTTPSLYSLALVHSHYSSRESSPVPSRYRSSSPEYFCSPALSTQSSRSASPELSPETSMDQEGSFDPFDTTSSSPADLSSPVSPGSDHFFPEPSVSPSFVTREQMLKFCRSPSSGGKK